MTTNFFPFPFLCLLSAALIGWLVGWLLGRLSKSRSSESLDAELAGKMRLLEDERDRLQVENADLKAAFRAQLDKANSELSAVRTDTRYEKDLREKQEQLTRLQNRIVELELQRWNVKNIVFPIDSADITPQGAAILNDVASTLSGVNGITVEIGGHTDNIDTDEHNLTLSQQRAEAVRKYLVAHGVPTNTLIAVGYGASRPIADNATEDGRQNNRRIEFVVKGLS